MYELEVLFEPPKLPQELIDCCAAFSNQSKSLPPQKLPEAMDQLLSMQTNVESSLSEFQRLLEEELEKEEMCLIGHEKRYPSITLKKLSLEAERNRAYLAKAENCNTKVQETINSHLNNLQTLSLSFSEIEAKLPSIQLQESSKEQTAFREFQRLIVEGIEMKEQRQNLEAQLRAVALQKDDITKLADSQTDLAAHLSEQLAKHKQLISLMEGNLARQENIIVALTEAHAETWRSIANIQQRRASTVAELLTSAKIYSNLSIDYQKGLKFYRDLDTNVNELFRRLRVFRDQQEKRELQEAGNNETIPGAQSMHRPTSLVTLHSGQDAIDLASTLLEKSYPKPVLLPEMAQYQQHPCHSNPVDPTNVHYAPPNPSVERLSPVPSAEQVASNFELLSLSDLSIPVAPASDLLEPQFPETPVVVSTQETSANSNN